jgi:hypothetical protein
MPVRTEATGTTSKSLRKYVSNIRGKREIEELQKTAILGAAHILRKVLKYVQNIQVENSITCVMNCEYRIAIKYILEHGLFQVCNCKCLHKSNSK